MAYITNRGRNARALQFYNSIGKQVIGSKDSDAVVDNPSVRTVFNYYLGLMSSADAKAKAENVQVLAKMCAGSTFDESGSKISGKIRLVTNEDISSKPEIYGGTAVSFQGETWYAFKEDVIIGDSSGIMNPAEENTSGDHFSPYQIYIYFEGYIDLGEVKKKGFTGSNVDRLLSVAVLSNVEFKTTPASWAAAPSYASISEVADGVSSRTKKFYIEASQLVTPVVMAEGITGRQRIAFLMQF